jgi:hypothetical protein
MRRHNDQARIIFCVDTDSYAGNFERELCAYMTGIVGECGVGEEGQKLYEADGHEPLEDLVDAWVPDDHGCHRPAAIQPTPGWFNSGMTGPYRASDYNEADVVRAHNEAVEDYAKNTCEKVYADKAHGKKEAERFRKEHTIKKFTKKDMHPAYNSVGIFLTREPTEGEIEFLKARAHKYLTERRKRSRFSNEDLQPKFKIEGFRVVVEKTKKKDRSV